jgi:hypothetical protein
MKHAITKVILFITRSFSYQADGAGGLGLESVLFYWLIVDAEGVISDERKK